MFHLDGALSGQNYGTLQNIAEFANVARPVVAIERLQHLWRHFGDTALVLAVQIHQQSFGNRADIALTLAKRRQVDVEYVQAVEEILTQMASADGFLRHLIRGG